MSIQRDMVSNEYKYNGILKGELFSFIAVDNFKKNVVLNASVFFLTHYHSDHYEGLKSYYDAKEVGTIFKENPEKLFYCSEITKRIFESNRGKTCFIPKRQIKSYPIGQPFNIFGPVREDKNEPIVVTVTFIPSGHILGAVMILFEHEGDCALFTGDFRIYPVDIPRVKALHDCDGNVKTISHLYLDTTFASVKFTSFPLRSEISKFVADVASKWLSLSPKNVVHLNLPYTFAYENLLVEVSKFLKCKVVVTNDTYEKYYRFIPELAAAVCPGYYKSDCRVHACVNPSYASRYICRDNILKYCEFCPSENHHVQLFRPSAMYFSNNKKDFKVLYEECDKSDMIRVPYSSHCSLEELKAFVNYINPKEIISIVAGTTDSDFKNNILSFIETPDSTAMHDFDEEAGKASPFLFELSDSDCNSDFDCGLDSPPR